MSTAKLQLSLVILLTTLLSNTQVHPQEATGKSSNSTHVDPSSTRSCPTGTSLSSDKLQCLADKPTFGLTDKPPSCKTKGDCPSNAGCYEDNYCRCGVGYNWKRPVHGDATCVKVKCTKGGVECKPYKGKCSSGSTCTCPFNFIEGQGSPDTFLAKCRPTTEIEPPCTSADDCAFDSVVIIGSVCYRDKCTCKFGFKRHLDACVKINCTDDDECTALGRCDHANQSCICDKHYNSDAGMTCEKNTKLGGDDLEPTTVSEYKVPIVVYVMTAFISLPMIIGICVSCIRAVGTGIATYQATNQPINPHHNVDAAANYPKQKGGGGGGQGQAVLGSVDNPQVALISKSKTSNRKLKNSKSPIVEAKKSKQQPQQSGGQIQGSVDNPQVALISKSKTSNRKLKNSKSPIVEAKKSKQPQQGGQALGSVDNPQVALISKSKTSNRKLKNSSSPIVEAKKSKQPQQSGGQIQGSVDNPQVAIPMDTPAAVAAAPAAGPKSKATAGQSPALKIKSKQDTGKVSSSNLKSKGLTLKTKQSNITPFETPKSKATGEQSLALKIKSKIKTKSAIKSKI